MPRAGAVQGLSWVDRLLVIWILGAMVTGVVCGKFAPVLRDRFAVAELYGTPLPIAVGLWLMMWPVLSKVHQRRHAPLHRGAARRGLPRVCSVTKRKPGRMHVHPSEQAGCQHGRLHTLGTGPCSAAALLRLPTMSQAGRRLLRWHGSFTNFALTLTPIPALRVRHELLGEMFRDCGLWRQLALTLNPSFCMQVRYELLGEVFRDRSLWRQLALTLHPCSCTQVRYELLGEMFRDRGLWRQLALSIVLNWVLGPLIMTGLAWACLPDAPMARYRNGVILVGLARCIAMVCPFTTHLCADISPA